MNTPDLLNAFECCPRKSYWSQSWANKNLRASEMVAEAVRAALLATESQDEALGEVAGSAVMGLGRDRGLPREDTHKVFDSILHHSAIADLLVSVIRKKGEPPWLIPPGVGNWKSSCLMSPDGQYLRRVVIVSHWSDSRHAGECRNWRTLGEIAQYQIPLQLIVCVIGQQRDGRRTSNPFSSGFLHPSNHDLRFRKRNKGVRQEGNVFGDQWVKIYREDHDEISRERWLQAMLRDDVLYDVCFREDIPVPPIPHLHRIQRMAREKLDKIYAMKHTPEANLSSCDWPLPCPFRKCCWIAPEVEPEDKYGFIRLSALETSPRNEDRREDSPISI